MNGWLILDKPLGISSAHAVAKVKRLLKPSKIGHAGTLDPLASGILPLALGEATKTVGYMMDAKKSYAFSVSWGQERSTDDAEGGVVYESVSRPTKIDIDNILQYFTGDIAQTPPSYSAIKVDGKRAYDMARGGEDVELKARKVRVNSLEMVSYHADSADFVVLCGKGTYVRSLARDMGRKLGCYGYVSCLRRLSVGKFDESCAISLDNLAEMVHKGDLSFLLPVESALDDILALELDSNSAARLQRGQTVPLHYEEPNGTLVRARCDGKLVGICEWANGAIKPVRMFNL